MSQLKTRPVVQCTFPGCPSLVEVAHVSTAINDPEGRLLAELTRGVLKTALCPYHQQVKSYYINQNRGQEWSNLSGQR